MPLLDTLHNALNGCDTILLRAPRELVVDVLRNHIQNILRMINENGGRSRNVDGGGAPQNSTLEILDEAGPGQREDSFMDVYFTEVREAVCKQVKAPRRNHHQMPGSGSVNAGARRTTDDNNHSDNDQSSDDDGACIIWCTLVFRMLCWLLLHDFHYRDVQVPKSELYGSRLPVYIA